MKSKINLALGLIATSTLTAQEAPYRSRSQWDSPAALQNLATADQDLSQIPLPASKLNETPFRWGPLDFRPFLNVGISYGNGLQSNPGQVRNTWAENISPGLAIDLGPRWTLNYTPRWTFYSHKDFRDTLAHDVSLSGGASWRDWKFGLSQSYNSSSDPLVETGTQTDQETFSTLLSASRPLGSKMLLQLGASQFFQFADALNETKSWSTMNWLNYQVAPRFSVAGGLGFGYDDVTLGSDMYHEKIQARVNARIAEKLNLSINGGLEVRQFVIDNTDDLLNPVYGASIQYRPFEQTTLTLSGNRVISPSLLADQLTESSQISVALNQRLLGAVMLTLSGAYGTTDYISSFTTHGERRSGDNTTFYASLSQAFWKRASASVYFQLTDNTSDQNAFDYITRQVGLNLGYHF
jgi:hypothetical protein